MTISIAPAAWQTGLLVGGIAAVASLQPSIHPRTGTQQAMVSGASIALGAVVGTGTAALFNLTTRRMGASAPLAYAVVAGAGLATAFGIDHVTNGTGPASGLVHTAGIVAAATAGAGLAIMAATDATAKLATRIPGGPIAARIGAFVVGAAVLGGAALLAANQSRAASGGTRVLDEAEASRRRVEDRPLSSEPMAIGPATSGGEGSLLPLEVAGPKANRFLREVVPAADIERVMGEGRDPVRVYSGLGHASTEEERVDLAVREAERLGVFDGGFDRVVVATPTGSGFINPIAIQAEEFMSRGRVATIVVQYNDKSSIESIGKVGIGARQTRALVERVHARISQMPVEQRPELALYGESMGAWASEQAFEGDGPDGLRDLGVDRALWAGSPYRSTFRVQALAELGTSGNPGLAREVSTIEQLEAIPEDAREDLRYVLMTHENDPVNLLTWRLAYRQPSWLDGGDAPDGVPRTERWLPGVSALQTYVDMRNGTTPVAGEFGATGHDYRADLSSLVRASYGHDDPADASGFVSTEQQRAINDELVHLELRRAEVMKADPTY